uniref:Amino acid permease/ SLC12A domain-containing protein n=1 Tax=Ciona savignyi TaxID=51511 RepID=H2ZQ47_CIOSA
ARTSASSDDSLVTMKKTVGFVEGTAIVLGIVVGSGIFLSPAGVAVNSGSVGLSLVIWALCGIFSTLGALSFAELGTTIPRSGGDYLYILEIFGPFWAFMRIWIELTVIRPASHAIIALTLSYYVVQINCIITPQIVIRLISLLSVGILTWINCRSSELSTRVQQVFTVAKVLALLIVIVMGAVQAVNGKIDNFASSFVFKGTTTDVKKIVLAINAGLWAFSGWNELNYVTDEIKNPARNLPLAVVTSMLITTGLYILVNLAYFTVLSPALAGSGPTAVIFGKLTMGHWSICIPIFVALCCFGGINGSIFTSSRLFYIGACEGHLPSIMGMINLKNLTPTPSIIVIGLISAVYMVTENVFLLINYVNFVYFLSMGFTIIGLILLRIKQPQMERPLKLPLIVPIIAASLCMLTGVVSFVISPVESGIGLAMVLTSVPVYIVAVKMKKPVRLVQTYESLTVFLQCMTNCVAEEI